MKAEEIEFFLLLKERIDNLANSSDVDQGKVSEIFERFLKLSKNHLIQPSLNYSSSNDELKAIKSDTQHIRFAVELMSDCTIDYSFILNSRVQNQLIRDNLRMENSRLSNEIKSDMDRFYSFCTYAFYQIEELINYYYYKNCASFGLFVEHIKLFYPNMKINSEKNISDVKSSIKIKSFEIKFLISKVYEHSFLDNIRITRNTESHRCSIIENLTNEQLFLELRRQK
ncbi:MAG: hypothetical protein IPI10_17715 [Bacteroidetes bacterium]|nr:hypothetical protein [Bacteroidota bacterium]